MNEDNQLTDEQMGAVTDAIGWIPEVPWRERVVEADEDDSEEEGADDGR